MSWFYSGLAPDDLVGYGDVEEALDALIAAGTTTLPGTAPAADPGRDGASVASNGARAELPRCEPPREDGPTSG